MPVRKLIERQSAFTLFRPILAEDHSKQVTAEHLARAALRELDRDAKVLDLGCGEGDSQDFFEKTNVRALWFGVASWALVTSSVTWPFWLEKRARPTS